MRRERSGVSEIIATILLVAVTVVAASVLFVMVQNTFNQNASIAAQVGLSQVANDNSQTIYSVVSVRGAINPSQVSVQIQDNGLVLGPYIFDVLDIRAPPDSTAAYNITWYDNDNDSAITLGDSFVIQKQIGQYQMPGGEHDFYILAPEGIVSSKKLSNPWGV